jgi:hypothetical protein
LEKLTDQIVLAKVAVEEKWLDICVAAITKVTDQVLLRQWAGKDPQAAIRQAAVKGIARRQISDPAANDGAVCSRTRRHSRDVAQ